MDGKVELYANRERICAVYTNVSEDSWANMMCDKKHTPSPHMRWTYTVEFYTQTPDLPPECFILAAKNRILVAPPSSRKRLIATV